MPTIPPQISSSSPTHALQLGLSVANLGIWRRMVSEGVPSAFIFEDDVLLHDRVETLFPR